jgi:hypothetical protein
MILQIKFEKEKKKKIIINKVIIKGKIIGIIEIIGKIKIILEEIGMKGIKKTLEIIKKIEIIGIIKKIILEIIKRKEKRNTP